MWQWFRSFVNFTGCRTQSCHVHNLWNPDPSVWGCSLNIVRVNIADSQHYILQWYTVIIDFFFSKLYKIDPTWPNMTQSESQVVQPTFPARPWWRSTFPRMTWSSHKALVRSLMGFLRNLTRRGKEYEGSSIRKKGGNVNMDADGSCVKFKMILQERQHATVETLLKPMVVVLWKSRREGGEAPYWSWKVSLCCYMAMDQNSDPVVTSKWLGMFIH